MRKLLVVVGLLAWSSLGPLRAEVTPAFAPLPGNLLVNGSFEHNVDQDSFPDHWRFLNYAPGGGIGWVERGALDGRIALRMSAPEGGQVVLAPSALANTGLPCVEGRSYVFSLYVRSEGPAQTVVQMTGVFADGRFTWEVGRGVIKTTDATDWTRYSWKFTGPPGIRTLSPWISHQQGTVLVDCFQIEAAAEPGAYGPAQYARLYVEPTNARHVYPANRAFTPEYTVHNDTHQAISAVLRISLAEVWGPGQWQLPSVPLSLDGGSSKQIKLAGAPRNLPPGRYRLTFTANDAQGQLCCQMSLEQTLAGPPAGPIPRFPESEPPITPQLQPVADGYSRLLIALASLEDLRRQIARALFYAERAGQADPDPTATTALYEPLAQAWEDLGSARTNYDQAYALGFELRHKPKTLTAEQQQEQTRLLTEAAETLTTLERGLPQLQAGLEQRLATLTRNLAPRISPGFKPAVVGRPGQPQQELTMDARGRTTGIIWGLCGHPDNVLRLQRWFNFGSTLDGRPGMRAPGVPASGPFTWFNEADYRRYQQAGLKYDSSFYTAGGGMTNAAATDYFLATHGHDPDIFLQTSTGETPSRSALNIWHPLVQEQVRDFCYTQARMLREDPRVIFHYYAWEPSFTIRGGNKDNGGVETGYNPTAKANFRQYLQSRFKTIAALNQAWGSNYESFETIEPPPDGLLVPRKQATPLTYEFEKWRQKSYADYYQLCYEAIKSGDPDHPCGISGEGSASFFNSCCYTCGIDYWQLAKRAMDFVETHSELYLKLPDIVWEHSLARLLNKPQLLNESNWDWSAPSHNQDERQWQATGEISLWRWMVWGRTYMNLMSAESEYVPPTKFYGQSLLEMNQDYTILRPAAAFMKIAMDKSSRYGDLLLSTRIATPKLAVLQSNTSIINCYPSGAPVGGYPHHPPRQEAFNFAALNDPGNYDHLYLPEEAVLEDGHDLRQYRAVLLPYTTHFPPGLAEKLLAYVRQGGWLICSGPPGVYDPYGRTDNRLLTTSLGACAPAYVSGNENNWVWALNLTTPRAETTVELTDDQGAPLLVSSRYGRGGLLVSVAGWRTDAAQEVYYRLLDAAIGNRTAWGEDNLLDLVTRVDSRGRRYLFAMNRSVDDTSEEIVHVEGEFPRPVDLGIGQRFPLGVRVEQGFTTLRLRLERGDSTVIALQP
jgi:hypothetical protein